MSVDVKCPKVPHQWGKIGQRVGQVRTVGPFSSATVLFRCKKISVYPRAKMSHTYFQNSVICKYRVMGDESLHPELSHSLHTHTWTLTDLRKVIVASICPKEIGHLQFQLCSLPMDYSVSLPQVSPISSSSPKQPHYALPESSPSS